MPRSLLRALVHRPALWLAAAALLGGAGGALSACDVFHSDGLTGDRRPSTPELVTPPADPTPVEGTFFFSFDGVPLAKSDRESLTSYNGQMRLEFRSYVGEQTLRFRIYVPATARPGNVYQLSHNGDFRVRFVRIYPDGSVNDFGFLAGAMRVDIKTDTDLAGTFRVFMSDTGRPGNPRTELVGVFNLPARIVQSAPTD